MNHCTDCSKLWLGSAVLFERFKILDKRTVGSVKPFADNRVGVKELGVCDISDHVSCVNKVLLAAWACQFFLGDAINYGGSVNDVVK